MLAKMQIASSFMCGVISRDNFKKKLSTAFENKNP
jgi:hypothetical protein